MSEPVTLPARPAPDLEDTLAAPGEGERGLEHARVKALVRSNLFGRGSDPVQIGRFTVLRRLGAGGMGVVYSAFDDELERKVAIKLLRPDGADTGAARARLRREAQAIARLSHPNVVPVFEVGEHRGEIFLAMEFVRGCTLRDWLREQDRDWREIRDVLVQAGRGLQAAHEAGIVHRDFKPDNVMVGEDGRVRVLDFGVASMQMGRATEDEDHRSRSDDETELALTTAGALVGTPAYMAPEALRGDATDARADQFSFCATLFEALFARRPFQGQTLSGLLEAMQGPEPLELPTTRVLPSAVCEALRRGLRPDPTGRFESMQALLVALERDPWTARRKWSLWLASATAVSGLGAGVWLAGSSDSQCDEARAQLASVWSPHRRVRAQQALASADQPVALHTWDAATEALDGYAAAWGSTYEDICQARDLDEEAKLQRQLCMQWGLQDLEPLTDALMAGDARVVSDVPKRVIDLGDPRRCLDPTRVREEADDRARRNAPPPQGAEGNLVSDFEDDPPWVRYGGGWAASTDSIIGGHSEVEFERVAGGSKGSAHALQIRGTVDESSPVPWSGVMLFTGESPFAPANLSAKQTFSFWARGEPGQYTVMLFTTRRGFQPAMVPFELHGPWEEIEIDLQALEPDRYDVTGMFIGRSEPGPFVLRIDDVAFE